MTMEGEGTAPAARTFDTSHASEDDEEICTECRWGVCNEPFISTDLLGKHLNDVHVGKKQASYVCEWRQCLRNKEPLPNRFALIAHLRRHTGERPYKCDKCGKCFSRSDALNKHTKAQHPGAVELTAKNSAADTGIQWHEQKSHQAALDSPSVKLTRLRRHFEFLEAERADLSHELHGVRAKIKRLRAEKLLLLDGLLPYQNPPK